MKAGAAPAKQIQIDAEMCHGENSGLRCSGNGGGLDPAYFVGNTF